MPLRTEPACELEPRPALSTACWPNQRQAQTHELGRNPSQQAPRLRAGIHIASDVLGVLATSIGQRERSLAANSQSVAKDLKRSHRCRRGTFILDLPQHADVTDQVPFAGKPPGVLKVIRLEVLRYRLNRLAAKVARGSAKGERFRTLRIVPSIEQEGTVEPGEPNLGSTSVVQRARRERQVVRQLLNVPSRGPGARSENQTKIERSRTAESAARRYIDTGD